MWAYRKSFAGEGVWLGLANSYREKTHKMNIVTFAFFIYVVLLPGMNQIGLMLGLIPHPAGYRIFDRVSGRISHSWKKNPTG